MTFTPTLSLSATWLRRFVDSDSTLRSDARFGLLPPWMRADVTGNSGRGGGGGAAQQGAGAAGEMIMAISRAGALVVAGTDTPNPASLHGELGAYVAAGMTPYEALRTATVNPAAALGLDAGSIEAGKLADLVIVDGNPLVNIGNAARVRVVIANGRVLQLGALIRP
jgi:hypothetical protein